MSMGGKTYVYIPDYTSANKLSERGKEIWGRYQDEYLPITGELTEQLSAIPARKESAGLVAADYADRANEDMLRTIAQYGIQLSPLQRESLMRKMEANKALGIIQAKTTQEDVNREQKEWLTQELINQGTGIRGASTSALETAANLEAQRNQQGYERAAAKNQASAAKTAGWQSAISTGIGIGTAVLLS